LTVLAHSHVELAHVFIFFVGSFILVTTDLTTRRGNRYFVGLPIGALSARISLKCDLVDVQNVLLGL